MKSGTARRDRVVAKAWRRFHGTLEDSGQNGEIWDLSLHDPGMFEI